MPLPLIAWAVIEIGVAVAARVIVRQVAKTVVKKAVETGAKQVVKKGTEQVAKKVTQTATNVVKKKGSPTTGNTAPKPHKGKQNKKDKKEKKDKARCVLRPYKPDTCKPNTGHHVVPDRVFRIGSRSSGKRIPGGPTESEGLVICVPGKNLSKDQEHGQIHDKYDKVEAILGAKGKPPGTATILELELLGAKSVAQVTGCDSKKIAAQLRAFHQSKGLSPNALVRADPYGKISQSLDASKLGSGLTNAGKQKR